jgi:hypothetical protein
VTKASNTTNFNYTSTTFNARTCQSQNHNLLLNGRQRASFSDKSSATKKSSSPSFMEWYEGHLEASPVLTKMITGTFLWGIGDAVAQIVPNMQTDKPLDYDYIRTFRAAFFGFAVHAPTSHLHFNFLEWMTQKAGVTGLGIPVFKTIMEQVSMKDMVLWQSLSVVCWDRILLYLESLSLNIHFHSISTIYKIVCILELGFQLHVSCVHGCCTRLELAANRTTNSRCLVGHAKGAVGVLDPGPARQLSIHSGAPSTVSLATQILLE